MMADEMMMDERRRLVPLALIGLLLAFGLPEIGLTKLLFAYSGR